MQVAWDKEAMNVATRLHFLLTSIPRKLAVVGCALIVVQGLARPGLRGAAPAKGGAVPSAPPLGAKAPSTTPARPTAPAKRCAPPAADSAGTRPDPEQPRVARDDPGFRSPGRPARRCTTVQQAKQIKARLEVGISRMNASQLQWFETDMQAKLKVLSSDQAREAEAYLGRLWQSPRRRTSASCARSFPTC